MNEVSTTRQVDTSTTRPLPPIECASWCEDGTGHIGEGSPENQYCLAGNGETELMRKPEKVGDHYYRRTIDTSLQQDPFSEPFVTINAVLAELTLDEAEAHATRVLELVAMARGEATEV